MLSRGLWPQYGNSDATWVILSFPHFAEWTSMLTYVLGFIWCCREINSTNTCILPCPRRVDTHLPIVISPFAWLQFIFKVVQRNNFLYLLILQSPQIVVFWHIMTKKRNTHDQFCYWCFYGPQHWENTQVLWFFNKI